MSPDKQVQDWADRNALVITAVHAGRAIGWRTGTQGAYVQMVPLRGHVFACGFNGIASCWVPASDCHEAMGTR